MNNNFFAFARHLRDRGFDAHLFCTSSSSMDHFSPQADTFEDVSKLNYIHDFPIPVKPLSWILFDKSKIIETFRTYDLIVACGISCAYLARAGITIDLLIPYGSDLYEVPFPQYRLKTLPLAIYYKMLARYQRQAFQTAKTVVVNTGHQIYAQAIKKLGVSSINLGLPVLYIKETPPANNPWSFLKEYDFVVFNHSRQIWCSNPDDFSDFDLYLGNKRNDKTIRAFADFLKTTHFHHPLLVMFEYGPDVECSKALIRELEIEPYVRWIKKSFRKDILLALKYASIAVDQVRENICGIGGTSFEIMASGIPLITHTDGVLTQKGHLYYGAPIIDVVSVDEITKVFQAYEENPIAIASLGQKGMAWYNKYLGEALIDRYVSLLQDLYDGKHSA